MTTSSGNSAALRRFHKTARTRVESRRLVSAETAGRSPQLETLECRSMLSTVTFDSIPAVGFRLDQANGTPAWEVSISIDGSLNLGHAFAESTDRIADAPALELNVGRPTWAVGVIGDTKLRGNGAATNDVDFYRIEVPNDGHYALHLRVVAQGVGSELDSAVTLFDSNGHMIAANDDALHEGVLWDAELFAGLDGETYFVAVSAGGNQPGEPGGFNPQEPGSGRGSRGSTGAYLLEVAAEPDSTRPQVLGTSIEPGSTLHEPPATITIRFSEPIDLRDLENGAMLSGSNGSNVAVWPIEYDTVASEVTYLLIDRPAAGDYAFLLNSMQITDRADNALDGGSLNGDFQLNFRIESPEILRTDAGSNDSFDTAQPLGHLYTDEMLAGIKIDGTVTQETGGDQDFYRFELSLPGIFTFRFRPGQGTNRTGTFRLLDESGNVLAQSAGFSNFGSTIFRWLTAGEYVVQMDASGGVPDGTYSLSIQGGFTPELPGDNNSLPAIQVTVRTNESAETQEPGDSGSEQDEPAGEQSADAIVFAVNSLPAVSGQPAGTPQADTAGATSLAWVDQSSGGSVLPAGFSLNVSRPVVQFSVNGVSGSMHDPLPDALVDGMHALSPSSQVVSELAALMFGGSDAGGAGWGGGGGDGGGASDEVIEVFLGSDEGGLSGALRRTVSEPTMALGMIAGLGAATVMTVPNRRRSQNWLQRALQALGLA